VHLAPHPEDESIGAPATLLELQAAGHHVINYPCSLGRAEQVDTRRAELEEACRRAGIELDRAARGFSISGGDDLAAAQRGLTKEVGDRIAARQVDILVAPSPHDGHHGHELVGRAARDVVEACGDRAPRLWLWGLWADLPWPTLYVSFDERRLDQVIHVPEAHTSQLARNDYREVVRGRAGQSRPRCGADLRVRQRGARAAPLRQTVDRGGAARRAVVGEPGPRAGPAGTTRTRAPSPARRQPGPRAAHRLEWWLGQESFSDRMRMRA